MSEVYFNSICYRDCGKLVYLIQTRLQALGYYHEEILAPEYAYFDEQTQLAVGRYQRMSGIFPADTVVNKRTWETLGLTMQDYIENK